MQYASEQYQSLLTRHGNPDGQVPALTESMLCNPLVRRSTIGAAFGIGKSRFCGSTILRTMSIGLLPTLLLVVLLTGCERSPVSSQRAKTADSSVSAALPNSLVRNELEIDIPLVNGNPGYLGAKVCGECHQSRLHEFQDTRHFLASSLPDARLMPPGFDDQQVTIETHLPSVEFQFSRKNDQYVQSTVHRPNGVISEHSATIGLVYGHGGAADEVYFAWHGDRLRELPLGWLHPFAQWGAQQFSCPDDAEDCSRVTTTRCLECHTTWFQHHKGTSNQYVPDSFLMSVSCERCHGPGAEHVAYHRQHPEQAVAHAIVHPGELTRDRRMDLCGQCHSNGIFRRTELFTFRPGDMLEDHFRLHLNPNYEDDNVANQVKYLKQSRCYQESDTLSCITCHSPHHRQSAAEQGRDSCRACHQPTDCSEQSTLPLELRNECATCHMPEYARLAVRFHTPQDRYVFPVRATQHRIAIYPEARDEALLAWHEQQQRLHQASEHTFRTDHQPSISRLRSALISHWRERADQYEQQYRYVAAIGALREVVRWDDGTEAQARLQALIDSQTTIENEVSRLQRLQATGQFQEAIQVCQRILSIKPDHAVAIGKLGTFYAIVGNSESAESRLLESAAIDPDNSYGYNMLGWLAYLRGDIEAAVGYSAKAEDIYPYTAENNYRWGLALNAGERWQDALDRLSLALQIDPNDANSSLAISEASRGLGRDEDALRYAYRAARLTNFRDLPSLQRLAAEYRAADRHADFVAVITEALKLPAAQDSAVRRHLLRDLQNAGKPRNQQSLLP